MREKHAEPLGPANDLPVRVTQELVALHFVDDADALAPMHPQFWAGMLNETAPNDPDMLAIWESGAFAAELLRELHADAASTMEMLP